MECVDVKENTRAENEYCNSAFEKENANPKNPKKGIENEYEQLSVRGSSLEPSTRRNFIIEENPTRKLKRKFSLNRIIILVFATFFVLACLQSLVIIFVLKAVLANEISSKFNTDSKSDVKDQGIDIKNDCGTPPHVAKSTRIYTSTAIGTVAYYRCLDDLRVVGDPLIFCQANGSWSDVLFSCEKGAALVGCGLQEDYIYKHEFRICYKVHPTLIRSTTGETHNNCSEEDAELLRINSQTVQEYFAKVIGTVTGNFEYLLIQGNDKSEDGTWVFDDGTPLTYFNWHSTQPDGKTYQHALAVNRKLNFQWFDLGSTSGSFTYIYICQFYVS